MIGNKGRFYGGGGIWFWFWRIVNILIIIWEEVVGRGNNVKGGVRVWKGEVFFGVLEVVRVGYEVWKVGNFVLLCELGVGYFLKRMLYDW